jgi:uncharacterized protein YfaS (alpha-2-macroglobulin family)
MKQVFVLIALLFASALHAAPTLRVVSAGPVGEVATAAEANEVRVTFSEPMVVVGRIPQPVTAPWFRIQPAVPGTFRWSGTTTLIFTPNPQLPFATKYEVAIDQSARSVAGNTLDKPYGFSFTTPTVRLLNTNWYRSSKNSIVIGLRFNQAVDPKVIAQHVQLRTVAHGFIPPKIPAAGLERLKTAAPAALAAFEAKVASAAAAAASNGAPILSFRTETWDRSKLGEPAADLVVLETKPGIARDTHLQVLIDDKLAMRAGNARTSRNQEYRVELEPTLFVENIGCAKQCDPERYNAIVFRSNSAMSIAEVRKAITVTDITDPAKERVVTPAKTEDEYDYPSNEFSFDSLGYTLAPARNYLVRVDPSLASNDGQTLGYTWMGTIENWHRSAFISFGDGQGVWEATGDPILPFHARNFRSVRQWLAPLELERLMPTILSMQRNGFRSPPPSVKPTERTLKPVADKIQSYGLNVSSAIGPDNVGLAWAAIEPRQTIPQSNFNDPSIRSTIVQVTNLGISVKDSPLNTLIFVTRLSDGKPVAAANVSIRTKDNKVFWSGTTDAQGLAIAPDTDLRFPRKETGPDEEDESWRALGELHFIVVAEKDGDLGYVGSDWNEGITPWELETGFDINESQPLLRGTVFTDRGVYKLGEEIHFKAVLRTDTPRGMQLLPAGTAVQVVITDSQSREVDKRTVQLNAWSSIDWTFRLPAEGALGTYMVNVTVPKQRLSIQKDFLVAAYRRPDFRVDVGLDGISTLAGVELSGRITGRYLHGGAMGGRSVKWKYDKRPLMEVPSVVRERFPENRFSFLGWERDESIAWTTISTEEAKLTDKGELALKLPTDVKAGWPFEYRLEGDVTDVTRQHIANRTAYRVDPAPWYIGIRRPDYFTEAAKGLDTELVAVGLDGLAVAGVPIHVTLQRIQWNSVRRAVGNGFYEWDTEQKVVPAGEWDVTSEGKPVTLHLDLPEGGEYKLTAVAQGADGRSTSSRIWFYAMGGGYTAWQRYDHNRIDLVPENKNYKPGETARILVKSPWERATALLTTEREGVRTWQQFELTSTQQTVTVPITAKEIPNVFVSVLLIKGRTQEAVTEDAGDPGKPSFRLGYVELKVEDATKRLTVAVDAKRDEFRPAAKADIEVNVKDVAGKPSQSEVTLWAVDYGVLSLTAYRTPDVLESIYLDKALQVVNEDSRQRIVSRRVLTPKGADEGGGGGQDAGPGTLRKDFRVLAFWIGSVVTDARGRARTQVTLPESLTTYRIMAVAGDRESRFGWGEDEIRVNKPLMVTPAFPRFMTVGDTARFGGVVNSQVKRAGKATVTIRSLDPGVIDLTGTQTIDVGPGSATEVRFDAVAKSIGSARIQMRVSMGRENDAFEETIPVRVLVSPETVAAYGEAAPQARETLQLPANIVPGFGGLRLELASTAMVGLGESASYLVEYPYGCAEQRASSALALLLVADLGNAFKLPGVDAARARTSAQSTLRELELFQCGDGGFAFWPGDCTSTSPYLTSWVIHVYQRGQKLGYTVSADVLKRAYEYLDRNLKEEKPPNEGWWPAFTAWQAFAVKTLAEGGVNVDSHINRIYGYIDRMPVFGIAYLADALIAKGERGARLEELTRSIKNSILPEGGTAHVGEISDEYLLWFWNSNVRSTAIALGTLVRGGDDEALVKNMVRWLMRVRKNGRWGNTQENAWAMESLVDYYRKYESEVPDFSAVVTLGNEELAREEFRGRTTEAKTRDIPMARVSAGPVLFDRQGTGTLFYLMRLRYASAERNLQPMNQGFQIERRYTGTDGNAIGTFKAGDLVRVTLRIRNTKERRFVAVTDPIPAGTEPVETSFATTASEIGEERERERNQWSWAWWQRGGWDHEERHDDRVNVFATRLAEGEHEYTYLIRATTSGTFMTAPAHVEEMYEPEVFGRTASTVVEVSK